MSTDFANPEFVERAQQRYREEEKEQKVSDIENAGTRAWLETELDSRSREVEIYDRVFDFRPIGTTTVTDTIERAATLDDDEDIGEMPQLFRDICQVLGEHCLDPEMDADAFGIMPPDDVQQVFEDIAVSDVDEEKIEKFQQE